MKLYHYSEQQYPQLLTRRLQGSDEKEIDIATFKAKRMGLPFPYHDHISLFFEPIPIDKIASTFPKGHPFWKSGNEIYEHVIELDQIDPSSFWRVVESLEQSQFSDQFDWENISDLATRASWFTKMHENDAKLGLSGYDTRLIYKAYRQVMSMSMLDFYRRAAFFREADNVQYAANVPHLMVYPVSGVIPVVRSRKVILGNQKADPVLFHLSFRKLPNTLNPRQPEDSGDNPEKYTERLPPRVSFSPSIQQAFCAIYPNISRFFEEENAKSILMNVYSPIACANIPQIEPKTVLANVWDAHYTGEVCFTSSVKVQLIGTVEIKNPYHGKRLYKEIDLHPYNNEKTSKIFACPIVTTVLNPIDKTVIMY